MARDIFQSMYLCIVDRFSSEALSIQGFRLSKCLYAANSGLTENQGSVLAPVPVAPVNETDMILFPEGLHALKQVATEVGLDLHGAYVKPRRAPAFGPARHWRFAGGAFTPPLTKGMLTPPWNPSIRFPALTGGA